jgi:hypothetical protein
MKVSDALEHYSYFSVKLSDVNRQLGFAGIAVIWIFKEDGTKLLPAQLILPTIFFVAALGLDLLHYLYSTIAWATFHRVMELRASKLKGAENEEFKAPRGINWPSNVLFYLKAGCVVIGYWLLYQYLTAKLM